MPVALLINLPRLGLLLNVTDADSISTVLENIRAEFGEVDILVNNAGITRARTGV